MLVHILEGRYFSYIEDWHGLEALQLLKFLSDKLHYLLSILLPIFIFPA